MWCRSPQRNYPTIACKSECWESNLKPFKLFQTCKAIVPVRSVLGAAAADQIERKEKNSKHCANSDGDVERTEVPVDVLLKKRILQVCCALLDCGHCFLNSLKAMGDEQSNKLSVKSKLLLRCGRMSIWNKCSDRFIATC